MKERFTKNGHIFEIRRKESGEIVLGYKGKENSFPQGCIWVCDDEVEAMDMVDAVIDPERFPEDEYQSRHKDEFMSNCKW